MRTPIRVHLLQPLGSLAGALFVLSFIPAPALAQTDTLVLSSISGTAGGTAALNLTLTSPAGNEPAAIQWTLTYSAGSIAAISASAGSAATAASKTITCAGTSGSYTCILAGRNATQLQNGTAAVLNVTLTPTASATIPINVTSTVAASPVGTSMNLTGTGGSVSIPVPFSITSLSCNPTAVETPGTASCSVTLNQTTGSTGVVVSLSSSNAGVSVPSSVTVPSGAATASFTATARTVTTNQSAVISATSNGTTQTATLLLAPPAAISSLQCIPGILGSSDTSTCTAVLSGPAPVGGAVISLSSDQTVLTVPASGTVPSGALTVTFPAQAGTVVSPLNGVVTATYNGVSQNATIQLATQESISAVVCSPTALTSLGSTNCVVSLTFAPTAGTQVTLSSNNPALSTPANVTVPAGSASASFVALAGQISSNQIASLTASLAGTSQSASLSLNAGSSIGLQSFGNQSISGSYFFRQVSVLTGSTGAVTDARSILGTMTFDGAGHYTYSGQLMQGTTLSPSSGSGAYSVDPAGMVTLDNPVRSGEKVNARYSLEAILGSSTESTGSDYDMLVAIPAPTATVSNGSLSGSYWVATLDFSGPSFANAHNTLFNLVSTGTGNFQPFNLTGHAANLSAGQIQTQSINGATYSLAADGSGTAQFGTASNLLNGLKVMYLSQDGNIFIGGSTASGAHDLLIGVKATAPESNAGFSGAFWTTGLRESSPSVRSFVGSAVASGSGSLYWTRRLKTLGTGNQDFTEVDPYSINTDGSGNSLLPTLALGASGNAFLGASISNSDPTGYEIYFGVRMDGVVMPQGSGVGLTLNPQGIQNVGSYAPTGNPIAPGELVYLYVSGLTVTQQTATPPYPLSLGGVTVLTNGVPSPLYLVSPTELVVVVPYATTGPTATIVVQSAASTSNTVTVPVTPTAPGVFSQSENGSGLGAIRHADYSVVTLSNPARSGEVVLIYLTGMGVVNPSLPDGAGSTGNPLNYTVAQPTILVGGQQATVLFSGMSTYPGLYQINAQLPTLPAGSTSLPLAVSTSNAYSNEIDIAVQP